MKSTLPLVILGFTGTWSVAAVECVAADLSTFRFFGVVDRVTTFGGRTPDIEWPAEGESVFGAYSFDPLAVDGGAQPYQGVYYTDAPRAVELTAGDFSWHSDQGAIAVIDGTPNKNPPQQDIYESVASRMTLDSPPDVFKQVDIWIFNLRLEFDANRWSDDSLPIDPVSLAAPTRASLTIIGDSTQRPDLSPVPLVIIDASLTAPVLGDLDGDADVDGTDFLVWQRRIGAPASGVVAVPEPSALALAIGLLFLNHIGQRHAIL